MLKRLKEESQIISFGLMLIAFPLWILSVLQARGAISNGIGGLGLFSILPFYFFVAFFFLGLSFFVTLQFVEKSRLLLLICQTILLILFLSFTPAVVEGTARFSPAYHHFKAVDVILQTGHLDPSKMWQLNWPSFSILWSIFLQITSIPEQSLLLAYPTIVNILLFVPLFILLRALTNDSKITWFAIWFFYLGNWVGQDYFSMQSIGYIIIILLIFLIFKSMNQRVVNWKWDVLFFLLFFYIASSHVLSSLAILSVILALSIAKYWRRPTFFAAALVCIVVGWTIFNANIFLTANLANSLKQILNFNAVFQTNLANRISGSPEHVFVTQVRVLYSAAIIILPLIGIILTWKSKKLGYVEKRILIILAGFSLLAMFPYSGEILFRIYIYSLPLLAYFALKGLKNKYVLCIMAIFLMTAAPVLHVIALYGNEALDYVPHSELVGITFLYKTTTTGDVVGGAKQTAFQGDFRDLHYRINYTITSFNEIISANSFSSLWTEPKDSYENRYVCISYATTSYYSFFVGNPAIIEDLRSNITQSTHYNLVYSNPSFLVYYSENATSP
jgi:hypothetical protein